MRLKENRQTLGLQNVDESPDMRFKITKEKFEKLSSQGNVTEPKSQKGVFDDPVAWSADRDETPGNRKPDMRLKENRQSLALQNMDESPDMRFKITKGKFETLSSQENVTAPKNQNGVVDDPGGWPAKRDETPRKEKSDMRLKENRQSLGLQNVDGSPDMRFKENRQSLGLQNVDESPDMRFKENRQSLGLQNVDGSPDMRFKTNKEKFGNLSSQENVTAPKSQSGVIDDQDGRSLKKNKPPVNEKPGMRLKHNRQSLGLKNMDESPDMRFKTNKEKFEKLLSQGNVTAPKSQKGVADDQGAWPANGDETPRKEKPDMRLKGNRRRLGLQNVDGSPDMRFKINRENIGNLSSQENVTAPKSQRGDTDDQDGWPLKKNKPPVNEEPDMRLKENRRSSGLKNMDESPDMRFTKTKEKFEKLFSQENVTEPNSQKGVFDDPVAWSAERDETPRKEKPDMRLKENRQTLGLQNVDESPDMRFKITKEKFEKLSSQGNVTEPKSQKGVFDDPVAWSADRDETPGNRKPDMRLKENRQSLALQNMDESPDMRFKITKGKFETLSSQENVTAPKNQNGVVDDPGGWPAKRDETPRKEKPDMRLKENRQSLGLQNVDGSPDMRFKENRQSLGLQNVDESPDMRFKENRQSLGLQNVDGSPDMRFKTNKEKFGNLSSQENVTAPKSQSGVIDDQDGRSLKKSKPPVNEKPDMRLKHNRQSLGMKNMDESPDMRFKTNKEKFEKLLSQGNVTAPKSQKGVADDQGAWPANGDETPRKEKPDMRLKGNRRRLGLQNVDGSPDMRFKINRENIGNLSSQENVTAPKSQRGDTDDQDGWPLKKNKPPVNEKPDMRLKENRRSSGLKNMDESPDMRFTKTKEKFEKLFSQENVTEPNSQKGVVDDPGGWSAEKDETPRKEKPDMRLKEKRQSLGLKNMDESQDMRFKINKENFDKLSSQENVAESKSQKGVVDDPGGWSATKDETPRKEKPDMRLKENRQSLGLKNMDESPDMRFKITKEKFEKLSSQENVTAPKSQKGVVDDVGAWSAEKDETPGNGKSDMRLKDNRQSLALQNMDESPDMRFKENRQSLGLQNVDGSPDMRFKTNKEKFGNLSSQENVTAPKSQRGVTDDQDGRPLKKNKTPGNGMPDMRLKENRQSLGLKNMDKSPDMRYKMNKEKFEKLLSQEDVTAPKSQKGVADDPGGWPAKRDETPRKEKPDMRLKENRQSLGVQNMDESPDMRFNENRRSLGLQNVDGSPDMRFNDNRRSLALQNVDGSPDMRFKINKEKIGNFFNSQKGSVLVSSFCGPRKRDGTPDMRYAVNKSYYDNPLSLSYSSGGESDNAWSSFSVEASSCGPLKSDGTPDMRYAINKSYYNSPLRQLGDSSGGESYNSMSSLSASSCGPLKSDGTPDMRYAANKAYYNSPSPQLGYSSGGESYNSVSSFSASSCGPLKSDGTPDMRYAANKAYYNSPSPQLGYSSGGESYNSMSSFSASSCGPLKSDGTPDMRFKANW